MMVNSLGKPIANLFFHHAKEMLISVGWVFRLVSQAPLALRLRYGRFILVWGQIFELTHFGHVEPYVYDVVDLS